MNETNLRHDESKVKLRAAQKWDDGIPLTLTEIAARYYLSKDTVRRRFLDTQPDAMRGCVQLYRPDTILRVMGGA